MRILVPLALCVFVFWEVNASKNEQHAKQPQDLQILLPKRKTEVNRKDSYDAKPSTTVLQTVDAPQAEERAANQAAPNGQHRTVEYVADKGGFRAGVATNEPGTESASGGGSTIVSTAVDASPRQQEVQQLAPLRIIDIQPFPAPLVRYEVAPNQPAPVPVHLLPPANNGEHVPQHVLPPQPSTVPLVHNIPGVAQSIGLVQTPVFHQQQPIAPQQFLVDHGQVPLLTPPDFNVIEQSDVVNNGPQQNQILPGAPVAPPGGNNVAQFSNVLVPNQGPQVNVQAPPPPFAQGPPPFAQGPPLLQAPAFFAPQPALQIAPAPTIHVAPPPAVQPPPPPQVHDAPPLPPPQIHVAPPPQLHLAPLHQNAQPPKGISIESARPQAHIEHVKLPGHRHAIIASSPEEILRPHRVQRPPLAQTVIQSGKPLRMPTIQPTSDAQIFEVKTKVIDHGEVPFNNNPRQLTRNLPFNGPILAAIKVADFSAPRDRVRNPETIFKNLPPPSRRPPPSASKQPEPLIFLAIPPSARLPKSQPRPKAPDLSKLFDAMPGPTVHDVAMHKFFNNIKQHHQNEVKFVKKHEHEFQALASRVMPFLLKKRMTAGPQMHAL